MRAGMVVSTARLHRSILYCCSRLHRTLDSLGIIPAHYGITLTLSSSNRPVIYFRDANGLGWELPINGAAEPSVDPAAILAFLPRSALSIHPSINQKSQKLPDC